jgi:hypothetical protein
MSYFKLTDGQVIETEDFRLISEDELHAIADGLRGQLDEVNSLITNVPQTDPEPTPEAPVEEIIPAETSPAGEVIIPAEAVQNQPVTVNGVELQPNADGTIVIDTTPEVPQAPQPVQDQAFPQPIQLN